MFSHPINKNYAMRLVLGLFLLAAALAFYTPSALAAGVVGNGKPNSCTEAAFDNALMNGGKVTFNCGSKPKTIVLTTYKPIQRDTQIDGGGKITLSAVTFHFVILSDKELVLKNMTVSDSKTSAIASEGTLKTNQVTFSNNRGDAGGALYNQGTAILNKTTFKGNKATLSGGAISNGGGLLLSTSTLSSNQAETGAGLYDFAGAVIDHSTFFNNTAGTSGGGIFSSANLQLVNSTLSGNKAQNGGGYQQGGGEGRLTFVTLANNQAATGAGVRVESGLVKLENVLLSKNTGSDCDGAALYSLGHNLAGDASCTSFTGNGDKQNKNAKLGVLASNGGATQTHLLLSGSPAINGGVAVANMNTDQRGVSRPQGGKPDIGAVEAQ